MKIFFANFGDGSIALMQWLREQNFSDVSVVSIDTGWAAQEWGDRIRQAEVFSKSCGFNFVQLKSKQTFSEHVIERGAFPTQQFQSCALLLKGMTFNHWLDEVDSSCEAKVLIGRRSDNRIKVEAEIKESQHFGGRTLLHPLANMDDMEFYGLIERAGFESLGHRSLECDPCIHNSSLDFERLNSIELKKLQGLEVSIDKSFESVDNPDRNPFESGCGTAAIFGCGV